MFFQYIFLHQVCISIIFGYVYIIYDIIDIPIVEIRIEQQSRDRRFPRGKSRDRGNSCGGTKRKSETIFAVHGLAPPG